MDSPLNNRMREVLHAIERHAGPHGRGTRTSIPVIADEIGYSTHTVRLAMRELRACGLLKCSGVGQGGSTKTPTNPIRQSRVETMKASTEYASLDRLVFDPPGSANAINVAEDIAQKCVNLAWGWVNSASRVLDILPSKVLCTSTFLESKKIPQNPLTKSVPLTGTLSLSRPLPAPLLPSPTPATTRNRPARQAFPASPSDAAGVVGKDLFGGADVARNGDLVSVMVKVWNQAQERKRAHWKDYIRAVNPSKIPPSLHDRLLRAWKENNLNLDQWRACCAACVTNTSLAGLSDRWDGATLPWLVRPDRTHVADVLSRKWDPDFNPADPPGTF